MSTLLLLLVACGPTTEKDTAGTVDDGVFGDVSARLSSGTTTVAIVNWTGDLEGAWVEFGPDEGYSELAPERAAGEAVLLGNHAATEVHYRVGAEIDGELVYTSDHTITTGELPSGVPVVTAERTDDTAWGRWVLTSYFDLGSGSAGLVILDEDGAVVWYHETENGWIPAERATIDGRGIQWLWAEDVVNTSTAEICTVDMDGEQESCISTPNAHHDFLNLDDGSLVYLQSEDEEWEGYRLEGDLLIQRDADGTSRTLWDAFDDITPVPSDQWRSGPDGNIDWTHCNGIWQDEANGDWIISSFQMSDVRRVSASTGHSAWILGGETNEFAMNGVGFGPQHAPQLVDGGLMLFDNGPEPDASRAVRFALDEDALTATEVYSYAHPTDKHAHAMGDANLTAADYVTISFGDLGDLAIWSPEGEQVWWWDSPTSTATGQVHVFADLYTLAE